MGQGQAGDRLTERVAALREALEGSLLRDRRRLGAAIEQLARRGGRADPREFERLEGRLQASVAQVEARRASIPGIRYDDSLPVHARRADIAAAIAASSRPPGSWSGRGAITARPSASIGSSRV